jgi:geranyl-CoA carboxylase alpha subunit
MSAINTLLVANRGEIALRVMRTARSLGIRTVAVFSDADSCAPHVKFADRSIRLGPAEAAQSYLDIERVVAAALESGADAIHPGYGFLSENAALPRACEAAGLVFVGPPAGAIEVMGDKARAKRAMIDAGVPCVPGYQGEEQSVKALTVAARQIGFPVMVKASAGGGGRGMRLVEKAGDLGEALKLARSEAENAFGSGDLIIEKAIMRPRHVEIQVFADTHGNVIHLGERDCSVQRRHQKVIEEAPCPVMTPQLRREMGEAALNAARAVDYVGAGTVEFLLGEDGAFHFLEMNTRLQVEHPVTEAITGLDLVALQLAVAEGRALPLGQEEVSFTGHAIEVRLCAEDPAAGFLPGTGEILLFQTPDMEGIRVDAGIETGGEVSPFYDSMVAKIIAHGTTRQEARRRLVAALGATALFGPASNRDFLIDALGREDFISGNAHTGFIADNYPAGVFAAGAPGLSDAAPAIALQHHLAGGRARERGVHVSPELMGWSSAGRLASSALYRIGAQTLAVSAYPLAGGFAVEADGELIDVQVDTVGACTARLSLDGTGMDAVFCEDAGGQIWMAGPARSLRVENLSLCQQPGEEAGSGGLVIAPMHGKLVDVLALEGASVSAGDRVAVLEAMKMQHQILAEIDGVVSVVTAQAGTQLAAGDTILEITPAEA